MYVPIFLKKKSSCRKENLSIDKLMGHGPRSICQKMAKEMAEEEEHIVNLSNYT